MKSPAELLRSELRDSIAAKRGILSDAHQMESFTRVVEAVVETFRSGGRVLTAGNGGSSADAQHLAAEFVCKLGRVRAPLPAESLTADMATLTAISNDFAFEEVFARQLECKATSNDLFIALTTSGNSPNILRALQQCRDQAVFSVLFTGRGGGRALELADISIVAPGDNSCRVQEVHLVLYHALVACVENALFFDFETADPLAPEVTGSLVTGSQSVTT